MEAENQELLRELKREIRQAQKGLGAKDSEIQELKEQHLILLEASAQKKIAWLSESDDEESQEQNQNALIKAELERMRLLHDLENAIKDSVVLEEMIRLLQGQLSAIEQESAS